MTTCPEEDCGSVTPPTAVVTSMLDDVTDRVVATWSAGLTAATA